MADHPGPGRPTGSGGPGPRVARFDDVPEGSAGPDRVADLGAIGGAAARPAGERDDGEGSRVAGFDDLATTRGPAAPVVPVEALRADRREAAPIATLNAAEVGAAPEPGRTADLASPTAGRRRRAAREKTGAPGPRRQSAPAATGTPAAPGPRPTRPRRSPAESSPGPGAPGQGPSEQGIPDQDIPEQGIADQGAPDDGSGHDPTDRGAQRSGRRAARADGAGWGRAAGRAPAALDPDADPVAVAREVCLRLLTDRARTRHELAQALRRKGVPDDAAEQVLGRFDEVGLIDDTAFAGQWVRSRHRFRGLGRRAIAMELRRKGVDDEIAGEALAEVDGEAEEKRARELVDRKLRTMTLTGPDERATAARRLVGMLARKGYGGGVAYGVVRAALAEHGAEEDELGTDPTPDD